MEPNEKNALRALAMLSVMDFTGLKSEFHHIPKHLAVEEGDRVVEPTST